MAETAARSPVWTIAPAPDLQIGVVEGNPDYQFYRLRSAVGLPDGRIAALNAGSHELRVYDRAGQLYSKSGRQGRGPGEFLNPLRLYLLGDTLVVLDEDHRLSLHNLAGKYIASQPLSSKESRFEFDEWLYDMTWVIGPPLGRGRAIVTKALDRLPTPDTSQGYRYVIVTRTGHLWVRQPLGQDTLSREWHVHDLAGQPIARVVTPAALRVYDIGADYVLGRVQDSLRVEYLRRYPLDTGGVVSAPYAFPPATPVSRTEREQQAVDAVGEELRRFAAKMEEYYADPAHNFRYARDHRHLRGYEPTNDIVLRLVTGHETGWTALAMHRATKVTCGMAVGTSTPIGWTAGQLFCP